MGRPLQMALDPRNLEIVYLTSLTLCLWFSLKTTSVLFSAVGFGCALALILVFVGWEWMWTCNRSQFLNVLKVVDHSAVWFFRGLILGLRHNYIQVGIVLSQWGKLRIWKCVILFSLLHPLFYHESWPQCLSLHMAYKPLLCSYLHPLLHTDKVSGYPGSLSLLFVMKVMVWYFVSNCHKVMTALIVVLPSKFVEISLQHFRYGLTNQSSATVL